MLVEAAKLVGTILLDYIVVSILLVFALFFFLTRDKSEEDVAAEREWNELMENHPGVVSAHPRRRFTAAWRTGPQEPPMNDPFFSAYT